MTRSTSLLSSIAGIMLASSAFAADIPTRPAAQPKPDPQSDRWTGLYGLFEIGVGQTKGNASTDSQSWSNRLPVQKCYSYEYKEKCYDQRNEFVTISGSTPGSFAEDNVIGALVGGGLGYNYRTGTNMVVGIEADGVYSFMNGYINGQGGTIRHQVPYLVSLTGRLIFIPSSMPNTGFYAKAGAAIAEQRTSINGQDFDQTKVGWTVGGGMEWQLPSIAASVRTEAMVIKVPDQVVNFAGGTSTLKGDIYTAKIILAKPINF